LVFRILKEATETIEKFSLGYSPESWDALTKEALGKGYKLEFLESTGLTISKRIGHLIVLRTCDVPHTKYVRKNTWFWWANFN
jgi:DNA primase